jgi:hypothetical protein
MAAVKAGMHGKITQTFVSALFYLKSSRAPARRGNGPPGRSRPSARAT